MKRALYFSLLFGFFLIPVLIQASWGNSEEWLDITLEYKDEISDKLKESKQFTEDQLEVINDCLDESSVKEVLNCFSDGGVDEATGALIIIRDELVNIRERICGKSLLGNKDKCDQFGDKIIKLKADLQNTWASTLEKGKQYLDKKNKLLFMKRKICKKINEEGCYIWLNERIKIKCSPQNIGSDPAAIEKCQLDVTDEVWKRINTDD